MQLIYDTLKWDEPAQRTESKEDDDALQETVTLIT